jgi:hypothetical protein
MPVGGRYRNTKYGGSGGGDDALILVFVLLAALLIALAVSRQAARTKGDIDRDLSEERVRNPYKETP